ncbi:unnamed protein product (macronuclear) [Paramecium tetraurelia]|uniref:Arp2/3 complex 34 kDa subunit n=1 Tax=Paramecium tetraurelia TaxID=5888 RepID=A0CBJ9_PARTE|nr:uncharacterized protein GSPATT00036949001 [Paramecium tetraurelia]CAK68166.1 unnamed protein product [Paramecium tetraurelia]|eukprot:XP_001435563.1 hypothetical protein (macronuclear) [Paramecium tetraurelia strain d4-2]
MMLIDPQNKLLQTQIMDLIMKKDPRIVVAKDYNYSCTKLQYKEDGKLFLSFTCFNFNEIFSIAGNYMIEKYYKDYTKEAVDVGFHLTFSFDAASAKEEPKIPKNATEAEKAEIQELKLQIRAENQKLFEKVTKDFSQIRRNFYAAAFEQAFDQINKGEAASTFKYQSRENEVVYAIPDKDALNIFYEISFSDNVDRTLANLIITEIIDAKKNVKMAPPISRSNYQSSILKSAFPEVSNIKVDPNSQLITMTLFKAQHFSKNIEQLSTFLQGFRQYLHYHIHASKTYLHSRIIKRISQFQRSLQLCQFEPEVEKKTEDLFASSGVKA